VQRRGRCYRRTNNRVLRVARTIADLAGAELVATPHVAEAIGYRRSLDVLFPQDAANRAM